MGKLSEKMWSALNEQVKYEMESGYLYLGMASWLNDQAFPGFAHWMRVQAGEEMHHAQKMYKYIEERGNRVELLPIAAPPKTWDSVEDVMKKSLSLEKLVSGLINKLVDIAAAEKDHATSIFLQWFVTEQVEEEETFRTVLDQLKMVKSTCSAMIYLDNHMAKRGE
ncbi:MAG: ferritin [Planctomycetaceae bacterium]|nr:ferritin [Planctomycetaceae bacterium]